MEAISSEQKTTLEQVVAGIPWQDEFTLGNGVDAITGSLSGSAVKPFNPTLRGNKISEEKYRFIKSEDDFCHEFETSASGKYNIEGTGVTGNASASYLNKIQFSEMSMTLIAEYASHYDGYDEAESYELTDEARKLIDDPEKFRYAFGDYFISGAQRMSRFVALIVIKSNSQSSLDQFNASLGGEVPKVLTAEGSVSFKEAVSKNKLNVSVDVFMYGYQGTSPSQFWSVDTILEGLKWFKEHEQGVNQMAKLKHYSTLVPTYTRSVEVSPKAFGDLRVLFYKIFGIRRFTNFLPPIYQNPYKDQFVRLASEVQACRTELPIDQRAREAYLKSADDLLKTLSAIGDRMDFFYKVKGAYEPDEGQETFETLQGQQIWVFGFSLYTKTSAVSIQSEDRHYSDVWQIGFRECTLEFYNPNALIVGWKVTSNWGDGTNGSWKKAIKRILLTNNGAVYVKSQFNRGCDWTVTYYYVNAADYQFD